THVLRSRFRFRRILRTRHAVQPRGQTSKDVVAGRSVAKPRRPRRQAWVETAVLAARHCGCVAIARLASRFSAGEETGHGADFRYQPAAQRCPAECENSLLCRDSRRLEDSSFDEPDCSRYAGFGIVPHGVTELLSPDAAIAGTLVGSCAGGLR